MLKAKINFYDKEHNNVLVKAGETVKANTKELVKYIRRYCKNAKTIIRHWDVNGKTCPGPMYGKDNAMWERFKKAVS